MLGILLGCMALDAAMRPREALLLVASQALPAKGLRGQTVEAALGRSRHLQFCALLLGPC
jgi:hypothetical protein